MAYDKYIFVMGTRPEIIKLYSLIKEIDKRGLEYYIIWTGQHSDYNLYTVFFEEFKLPNPDYDLGINNMHHNSQIANIMVNLSKIIENIRKKSVILSLGDTNSALATGLTATKCNIDYIHIEAGMRSFDTSMPEEINRKILDHIATINFAPTTNAACNLVFEGIPFYKIKVSGDTLYDVLNMVSHRIKSISPNLSDNILHNMPKKYILVTLHRFENTENIRRFKSIIYALNELAKMDINIIFPIHPRTKAKLKEYNLNDFVCHKNIFLIEPVSYFDFLLLLFNSMLVITDSGGVQQEAFIAGKPCITLRYNTEWIETIINNANILVGADKDEIISKVLSMLNKNSGISKKIANKVLGEGKSAEIISDIISNREVIEEIKKLDLKFSNFRDHGIPKFSIISGESFVGKDIITLANNYNILCTKIYRKNQLIPPVYNIKINKHDIIEAIIMDNCKM